MDTEKSVFENIKLAFEEKSGLKGLQSELKERGSSAVLVLKVAYPTTRMFEILEGVRNCSTIGDADPPLVTLVRKAGKNLLQGAEGKLLIRTLSESLNINRYSFQSDFFSRYTQSVAGAEEQITASANHVVYGRRGAGKSTLLLYAYHIRENNSRPSVWVDMQVYARRNDDAVIADVLSEILGQASQVIGNKSEFEPQLSALKEKKLEEEAIRKHLPTLRRLLSYFAHNDLELFVFLDDFHVLGTQLQAKLLDVLYAISRGNKIFLKLSAIETLTRTFNPVQRQGLEIPHDAQIIPLDYNLTISDKATKHIETILDSHALFCGLPSIRRLCTSADVIPRLTWVAAGVPRDALSLFSSAMTKATIEGRRKVSVSNVNMAASEAINTKLREIESDVSAEASHLNETLEAIREFCVNYKRRNAFLVEIRTDNSDYEEVRKLVDLRLLHVINEGITIGEAGRKYLGLILDYGFYTGIRAAQSVGLFNSQTGKVAYKELRKLPVFSR